MPDLQIDFKDKMVPDSQSSITAPHILIVEDDREMAKIIKEVLSENGYRTSVARDGNEGLAIAESKSPDLIVLDIMMPRRSGFLVLERLGQILEKPIPVIVVTGNMGDRHRSYAEMLGVCAYLYKPVKIQLLLEKIDELLNGNGKEANE
jgi:DNA-binding response OmpR family regulator